MDIPTTYAVIGIVYTIILLSIIVAVYSERKKPIYAVVWMLTVTILPILGFLIYFIFGRNIRPNQKKIFANKREYDALYESWFVEEKHILDAGKNNISAENLEKYHDIIEMNIKASGSIYSQDNDITIFTTAQDKYAALFKDIEKANDTIHILYFSINNDDIGRKFVNLLAQKAAEGIRVRLLYDHAGNWIAPGKMFAPLINSGGKVRSFFPWKYGTYFRFNYRNHRKIVVIDGKIAYMGGMNIGDEYLGLDKRIKPWRDTHLRITGTAVHFIQLRFLKDWYYSSDSSDKERKLDDSIMERLFPAPVNTGGIGLQLVPSGPDSNIEQIKRSFIKMINSAKEKIYIQTPYFIPDEPFMEALQIAALSGVDVRVMIPAIADKKYVYRATTSYVKDLLDYGVKVYLYPGFLHAKMITMDEDITSLGSSNMDLRSFMLDFEINVFVYDPDFSKKCVDIFNKDMSISKIITKDWYNSRSLWIKFQEGLFRLFAPMF